MAVDGALYLSALKNLKLHGVLYRMSKLRMDFLSKPYVYEIKKTPL